MNEQREGEQDRERKENGRGGGGGKQNCRRESVNGNGIECAVKRKRWFPLPSCFSDLFRSVNTCTFSASVTTYRGGYRCSSRLFWEFELTATFQLCATTVHTYCSWESRDDWRILKKEKTRKLLNKNTWKEGRAVKVEWNKKMEWSKKRRRRRSVAWDEEAISDNIIFMAWEEIEIGTSVKTAVQPLLQPRPLPLCIGTFLLSYTHGKA